MRTSPLRQVLLSWGPCGDGGGEEASECMARPAGRCGERGTLEPCLDKTSHSPLVRATSSLIGHLNSSVRKESRGEGGRAETGLVDSRGPRKRTHGRASSLTQGAASWEPVWEVLGQWGRAASRGQPSASREEPGSGLTYSRCGTDNWPLLTR